MNMMMLSAQDQDRKALAQKAVDLGYSKKALWNLDLAIADLVIDYWREVDADVLETLGQPADMADRVLLAAVRCDIHEDVPEDMETGLRLVPALVRHWGPGYLLNFARLMQIFADYTCAHPADLSMTEWRAAISLGAQGIQAEAEAIMEDPEHPTDTIEEVIEFLITRFRSLWD